MAKVKNMLFDFEQEQMKQKTNENIANFNVGDTVSVESNIFESDGTFVRTQVFDGVCIARRNRGINSSFKVFRGSMDDGLERTFYIYSSTVKSVKVLRRGVVRRAKIYYFKKLQGKSARIKEPRR